MSEGTLRKDMEMGQQCTLINEESCYDGNVVLSKRYKASDMKSGKDASVLESRTVRARGRTWNDNIIWVKGNCLQRDDDELLDLRFRFVKQSVKSTVERKESLLDEVTEEETKLELVLGELGLSRKMKVESKSKKVAKAQSTRSMAGADEGIMQTRKRRRVEPLGVSEEKVAEGRSVSVDDLREVKERAKLAILQGKEDTSQMLRAAHAMAIGQLQVEAKANLDETAEEHDRLGRHLMMKGYSQVEVDAIKADTSAEEEEEEAKMLGVVDGLDGVSHQTVLDNQGDDVELPESGSEKVVKKISFRINDLESGLATEIETSKALLSAQAELQAELDASRVREDPALMCNGDFVEQFDKVKEANENRENLIELERMRQKFIGKHDELRVARENLSASKAAT
ncbi:hypothetical protein GIB67_008366 [Kingdonia uniflora]|uniref:Uncharacterized protein n=1 Tax=Kingdonia uniflora TaxID=39325 RepID=A0A7J7N533_9MAGN|nr:hypothetical protein GIB67_008366 [Kingdonia uniflora]